MHSALLAFLFAAFASVNAAKTGGLTELTTAELKDPHLLNVAGEAIDLGVSQLEKISTAVGVEGPKLAVNGIEILGGSKQVVAGIRYRLMLKSDRYQVNVMQ